jgi:hypothetical protein
MNHTEDVGLGARTMVVEIGIEVGGVELLHAPGVPGRDIAVAHVFADDGAVFGFDQDKTRSVVSKLKRPLFVASEMSGFG